MFHHTHAYLATKLYKSENALLIIGSFLPDLAITGIISWEEGLHGEDNDATFFQFIEEKYPKYKLLAEGVHAHNIVDDYTHIQYRGDIGYAFQNNKELSRLVGLYYELDEQKAQGKAHNYIESAVDIFLLQEHAEMQLKIRNAIKEIDIPKISQILAEYFHKSPQSIEDSLKSYFTQFTKYDFTEKDNWLLFWADLEKLMKLKPIGDGKRLQLINRAQEITKNNYNHFLEYVIRDGSRKTK